MVTDVRCKHRAIMVTGVYCKSCAMMVTAVQCWPPYLEPRWSLESTQTMCLVPWSVLSNADPLSCTMLVICVHCKPLPCDTAATSVCSAMFTYTMSCRHHRTSKLEVLNASTKTNFHQMTCIKKRLQVQRMCWPHEYSVASSQSVMYTKHTSNNGQMDSVTTLTLTHS